MYVKKKELPLSWFCFLTGVGLILGVFFLFAKNKKIILQIKIRWEKKKEKKMLPGIALRGVDFTSDLSPSKKIK